MELQYATDPYNAASHPPDEDGDKIPDAEDGDIDGDGALNEDDAFPFDPAESLDTDGDGTGNVADEDDDGDGFPDSVEVEAGTDPLSAEDKPTDLDGDSVANEDDAFPEDPTEVVDSDGDGTGNNADEDDDGDGDLDLYSLSWGQDRMFLQEVDHTFSDVTTSTVPTQSLQTRAGVVADFDGDDLPDIFSINYDQKNSLKLNLGQGYLSDASDNLPWDDY